MVLPEKWSTPVFKRVMPQSLLKSRKRSFTNWFFAYVRENVSSIAQEREVGNVHPEFKNELTGCTSLATSMPTYDTEIKTFPTTFSFSSVPPPPQLLLSDPHTISAITKLKNKSH